MEIDSFVAAFVQGTLKQMQKYVQTGVEVLPQVLLFAREKDGGPAIIPLIGVTEFFRSKEEKRKLRPLVKKVWQEMSSSKPWLKLMAVVMLSDAWVENVSMEEFAKMLKKGRDTPFSPKPGMAEALMIVVSMAEGELQYEWPYVRGKDEIVFAKEPTVEKSPAGPQALLMGLWPL